MSETSKHKWSFEKVETLFIDWECCESPPVDNISPEDVTMIRNRVKEIENDIEEAKEEIKKNNPDKFFKLHERLDNLIIKLASWEDFQDYVDFKLSKVSKTQ